MSEHEHRVARVESSYGTGLQHEICLCGAERLCDYRGMVGELGEPKRGAWMLRKLSLAQWCLLVDADGCPQILDHMTARSARKLVALGLGTIDWAGNSKRFALNAAGKARVKAGPE